MIFGVDDLTLEPERALRIVIDEHRARDVRVAVVAMRWGWLRPAIAARRR